MSLKPFPRRIAWWALIALTGSLVFAWTNLSWAAFTGTRTPTPAPITSVPLPGQEVPILPSYHIPYIGAPHIPYNSLPPTSGPHVPWVIMTGIYSQRVPNELLVHALEHGHINIQYAPRTPAAQVAVLRSIALQFPRDVVLVPYPELRSGIALTAWGRIERLRFADRGAIATFIVDLRGRYNHGWSESWAAAHGARLLASQRATGCGIG
jgi:hypothetical protein